MEKKSTKVDFSPISCKKAPFYSLEIDTFKFIFRYRKIISKENYRHELSVWKDE